MNILLAYAVVARQTISTVLLLFTSPGNAHYTRLKTQLDIEFNQLLPNRY